MMRRVAATAFVLALTPALVSAQRAQEPVFTVTAQSAEVHKGPSTVTPVIGHVARGAALPVGRNLGSWVRITWPSAPDGVGYVHVTMGRLTGVPTEPSAAPSRSTSMSTTRPADAPTRMPASPSPQTGRTSPEPRVGVQGPQGVTTISHVVGVGGLVQSAKGFGATGRAWRTDRVGVELRVTRNAMTSDTAAGRMTSLEFEPRVAFALFDHVSDYVWVRPYVGSGVSFGHHTLKVTLPEGGPEAQTASSNHVGLRLFGGSELTFAGATRFGLSAEAGYRPSSTPFPGFETDRFTLSIAGHWYIK
jgi:hypothetical protein